MLHNLKKRQFNKPYQKHLFGSYYQLVLQMKENEFNLN